MAGLFLISCNLHYITPDREYVLGNIQSDVQPDVPLSRFYALVPQQPPDQHNIMRGLVHESAVAAAQVMWIQVGNAYQQAVSPYNCEDAKRRQAQSDSGST